MGEKQGKIQRSYKIDFSCNCFLGKADETHKTCFSMNFDGLEE